MGLHAEERLLTFLALLHLWATLARGFLGRAGRGDQRGVHHGARTQQQPLGAKQFVDQRQDLGGQFLFPQQPTKPLDRRLVGHCGVPVQACEFAEQRHVVQRLFHRRIAQREPLLHEVDAQHRLHCKRRAATLSFRGIGRNQGHQRNPRHHTFHLRQELALARALGRQVQAQVRLLHAFDPLGMSARRAHREQICADLPLLVFPVQKKGPAAKNSRSMLR